MSIKFPLNFQKGLGYSPASAGPVGGLGMTYGTSFYGQPLNSILPKIGSNPTNSHFFGRSRSPSRSPSPREINWISANDFFNSPKKRRSRTYRKTPRVRVKKSKHSRDYLIKKLNNSFGYPLMNQPNATIDMNTFPDYPVGPGDTPGGNGGVWLQGMPGFDSYWGFGKKRRSQKIKKSRRSRRSRRSRKHG